MENSNIVNRTKEIMKKEEKDKDKKSKLKIKEYDEIICRNIECETIMNVEETLKMVDGYKGYCTCPKCGKKNHVVKTRPADEDYNIVNDGQRVRKNPKLKMSKKQRRKINKELKK